MDMSEFIGRRVRMHFKVGDKDLYFTGEILSFNDVHMIFKDKFLEFYTMRVSDLVEVSTK